MSDPASTVAVAAPARDFPGPGFTHHAGAIPMYTVEINAETRTPQGVPISTFYRSTRRETVAAAHAWVAQIDRALDRQFTRAHVTIRTEGGSIYQHYRWVPTGPRRPYCPSKRRRYK